MRIGRASRHKHTHAVWTVRCVLTIYVTGTVDPGHFCAHLNLVDPGHFCAHLSLADPDPPDNLFTATHILL